mgnify:CR=1 FL=1
MGQAQNETIASGGDDRRIAGIPLALILTILLQTGTGIWWAATITADMNYLKEKIELSTQDRYTKTQAKLEIGFINAKLTDLDLKIRELEKELNIHNRDPSLHHGWREGDGKK